LAVVDKKAINLGAETDIPGLKEATKNMKSINITGLLNHVVCSPNAQPLEKISTKKLKLIRQSDDFEVNDVKIE